MKFKGKTITFNGINSTRFGLYLCNTDGSNSENEFGINRILELSDDDNSVIKKIKNGTTTVEIQLVKLNDKNNATPITEDDLFEINRWLFSPNEYKPLIVDQKQIVYYGVFVNGTLWRNGAKQGYLTLEFQLNSSHGYSVLQNSEFRVNGSRRITLDSKHNSERYNEVDIEIVLADNQNSIIIENYTTGQRMELKDLPSDCKNIYIYNDGVKHVSNLNNKKQNLRPYFNKVFLHLSYGKNDINITTTGKVRFVSQAKVLLQ